MLTNVLPALTGLDMGIARDIASIQAIDQHAHPVSVGIELPGDPKYPIQPYDVQQPLRMRHDNREYLDAWSSLWGYEERDWSTSSLARLIERKESIKAAKGVGYNVWVLDQLNIKTMIGIAPGPSPSEPEPRFRWCAFSDWFLWPFSLQNRRLSTMQSNFRATNDRFSQRWSPAGRSATLDAYLADVVISTLNLYKQQGAVGIKFQTPYSRPISFDSVSQADAMTFYSEGMKTGELPAGPHKALQDFLFERLTTLAGESGFIVQMHTGYGACDGFAAAGSNPMLMERIFHTVKGTKFVLLHGGWPFVTETVSLLANLNVYTDFSCATLYHYPRRVSTQIRAALEWYPEKLLYGTDAYSERSIALLGGLPFRANPLGGWEEKAWLMDRTGRTALALALSGMREDGEIAASDATKFMHMVMGETAAQLYELEA